MQIRSFFSRGTAPLEDCGKNDGAAKNVRGPGTSWRDDLLRCLHAPDDITVTVAADGSIRYEGFSPAMRLSQQWERWREQMEEDPDAGLPEGSGWTEENVAYLKGRYGGELTWVEREDALETMRKMGLISGNQASMAHGGGLQCSETLQPLLDNFVSAYRTGELNSEDPLERDWEVLFKGTPIVGFRRIDDVLAWAKELPDDTFDPLRLRISGTMESL